MKKQKKKGSRHQRYLSLVNLVKKPRAIAPRKRATNLCGNNPSLNIEDIFLTLPGSRKQTWKNKLHCN
jgi:hypothetical protein